MDEYDFSHLLDFDSNLLIRELAEVHSDLARLHARIGFLRAEEVRDKGNVNVRTERHESEGYRDALIEKKFLLIRLLENK